MRRLSGARVRRRPADPRRRRVGRRVERRRVVLLRMRMIVSLVLFAVSVTAGFGPPCGVGSYDVR